MLQPFTGDGDFWSLDLGVTETCAQILLTAFLFTLSEHMCFRSFDVGFEVNGMNS